MQPEASHHLSPSGRPRARGLGIPFDGEPGPLNATTDVPGLAVGYKTLIEGHGPLRTGEGPVRTGVTAILPRGRDGIGMSGALTLPVLITNTHAVGMCHRGCIDWIIRNQPAMANEWMLPVVAETWDGYLNDINGPHVRSTHAGEAIDAATDGLIAEGSVGGGTGMNCYAFKGGSGTASRRVSHGLDKYTVGAFVQANFGSRHELVIAGVPVGRRLADDNPMADAFEAMAQGAGSVIVLIATNAPLLPGQCKALARRVPLGLARTGTAGSYFSGDLFLAFSTANKGALNTGFPKGDPGYETLRFVPWNLVDGFYEAVVQTVEEAVVNALVAGETTIGRDDHRSPGLPIDKVLDLLGRQLVKS